VGEITICLLPITPKFQTNKNKSNVDTPDFEPSMRISDEIHWHETGFDEYQRDTNPPLI
jgi:hypothetical protein